MRTQQLVKHAEELLDFLKSTGHREVKCKHIPNVGRFIDAYQAPLPEGAGVYLFQFDDGDVFYIGKTERQEATFTKRVWDHLGSAPKLLDSGQRGFPNATLLPHLDPGSQEFEAVRSGHIRIDYLVIEPEFMTSLFEVYLQTVHVLSEGHKPRCNKQIG